MVPFTIPCDAAERQLRSGKEILRNNEMSILQELPKCLVSTDALEMRLFSRQVLFQS